MVATEQRYDKAWFQSLDRFNEWNERALLAIFSHLGRPTSMLDVGSGNGYMIYRAWCMGVRYCVGIEASHEAREFGFFQSVLVHDLEKPLTWLSDHPRQFDLVACIEVAEHLRPEAADTLCDTLVRFVGKYLVFTAAAPGQGGDGHINCQPQEYWREKLQARGLVYSESITDHMRETWKWVTGPMFWLPQNIQVFAVVATEEVAGD